MKIIFLVMGVTVVSWINVVNASCTASLFLSQMIHRDSTLIMMMVVI